MVSRKTRLMSALLAILMVVSMLTAYVLPAVAEDVTYLSVQTVTVAATSGDYAVTGVADWMYLFDHHATLFASRDITIHLTADIDLSDSAASTFTGFANPLFSFDGHGKVIKNWKVSGVNGLFSAKANNTGMNFLKNFTVQNCQVTLNSGNNALVLGGLSSSNDGFTGLPTTITLENIHVTGCTVATSGQANALLVGRIANAETDAAKSVTLNIKNCTFTGNTMTGTDAHFGVVIGKVNKKAGDVIVNISDIYVQGNTLTNTGSTGGLLFGKFEDAAAALNVSNVGIFDNKLTVSGEANILGGYVTADTTAGSTTKNILIRGNTLSGTSKYLYGTNPQKATGWTFSEILIGTDEAMGGKVNPNTNIDSETAIDPTQFATGEAAYRINQNLTDPSFYWSMSEDGGIVLGTEANRVRMVNVTYGEATVALYANGGSTVNLPYSTVTGATGEGSSLAGTLLTIGTADVAVNVPADAIDYTALRAALAAFEGQDGKYFVTSGGENAATVLETIRAASESKTYATQGDVDAAIETVNGLTYATDYTQLPAPGLVATYPDAPGYLVSTLADLEALKENVASFTADQTIYLGADITVTSGSAANSMVGLKASIDGKGHAIKGVTFTGTNNGSTDGGAKDAWLGSYAGKSIKNLTIEGWNATNLGWQGALLISQAATSGFVMDNVKAINCSAATGGKNGLSVLIGISYADLSISNITIEGCTLDKKANSGNSGFILGRYDASSGTLTAENIYLKGNTVNATSAALGGSGVVFGELGSAKNVTIKNVAVLDTTYAEDAYLAGIVAGRVKNVPTVDSGGSMVVDNILVAADDKTDAPVFYLDGVDGGNTYAPTVTQTNVYTDAANILYENTSAGKVVVAAGANATAEEINGGAAAYKLNAAGVEQKWMMANGYPAFSKDGVTMNQFTIIKEQLDASYASEYAYYNPGDRVELTLDAYNLLTDDAETTVTDYTYADKKLSFTMPANNVAAKFELTGADFAAIEEIRDQYAPYAGKFDLFTQGDAMKAAYDKAVEVLDKKDEYTKAEGLEAWGEVVELDEKVTEIKLVDTFTSVDEYNAPSGADYALFKDFDPVNWIVAEAADWAALTNVTSNFSGKTIHLVADIQMSDAVAPLGGYNKVYPFAGTLDGHGKVFKNLTINYTPEAGKDIYVGLVGALGTGTIQNLGIESGRIYVAGATTGKEAMVGGIAGAITSSGKIIHCWNGAEVNSAGYGGGESTSGIARMEGGVIDGCYNSVRSFPASSAAALPAQAIKIRFIIPSQPVICRVPLPALPAGLQVPAPPIR